MKKKLRNPLWKRLPRELVGDIGKYLVIFLFMTATIGFVSGFLVADESMLEAYDESFEKYRIENGNFTLDSQATEEKLSESTAAREISPSEEKRPSSREKPAVRALWPEPETE